MAVLHLIRHAQASFGMADYDRLSDLGRQQAHVLGNALRRRLPKVDLVVTGAMQRHRDTAEIALRAMELEIEPTIDPRWNEYDFRELIVKHKPAYRSNAVMAADIGRHRDRRRAFQTMFDAALERWVGGRHDDEYSESWQAFADRASAGISAIEDESAAAKNVLVFSSGGPISAVCAELLGIGADGWLRLNRVMVNAAETKVISGRSGISLVSFNVHSYFEREPELLTYR